MKENLRNNPVFSGTPSCKAQSNSPCDQNTTQRMIKALRETFLISPALIQKICTDQSQPNINDALRKWLQTLLISPDKQFGYLLMPLVAQRFDEYIDNLRGHLS